MNEKGKLLECIEEYASALRNLSFSHETKVANENKLYKWRIQVEGGKVSDPEFANWITNLANYYREKDREWAMYLEGLLK